MKNYIAYGSNINVEQMACRCPDAEVVGTGVVEDYELVFRASGVATVEPKAGSCVPVVLWKISRNDEKALDVYEGFPRLYTKSLLRVKLNDGKILSAMAYLMTPNRGYGCAPAQYLSIIEDGYKHFGFDTQFLFFYAERDAKRYKKACSILSMSIKAQIEGTTNICPRCGKPTMKDQLHTNAMSRRADIYVCDTCGMMEAINDAKGIPDSIIHWNMYKTQSEDI